MKSDAQLQSSGLDTEHNTWDMCINAQIFGTPEQETLMETTNRKESIR